MQEADIDADHPTMCRPTICWDVRLRILSACALVVLGTASSREAMADADAATTVAITAECLEYRGLLTAAANQRAFSLFAAADHKPTTICVDSKGGSAQAGMQLGAWIFFNALNVNVEVLCLSSCANYVLPAGKHKVLGPHATLLWHGGATQPLPEAELNRLLDSTLSGMTPSERDELLRRFSRGDLLSDLRQSLRSLIAAEIEFFRVVGVDPRIATLGHIYEDDLLTAGQYFVGWDYSLEDLATLGVRNVVVAGDGVWAPHRKIDDEEIFRLELKRLPGFAPLVPERG